MIKNLKGMDREIFIRRYLIQEDIVDIASVVDNRLSRSRKILKEKLEILKKGECVNE